MDDEKRKTKFDAVGVGIILAVLLPLIWQLIKEYMP